MYSPKCGDTNGAIGMTRSELVEKILDIKRAKGWTWKHITSGQSLRKSGGPLVATLRL